MFNIKAMITWRRNNKLQFNSFLNQNNENNAVLALNIRSDIQ